MFAIAFDLVVANTEEHHPKGVAQAYADIGNVLAKHGYAGSLYITNEENLAVLFQAILALKALTWFSKSVRDIRAFRVEQWSDFTQIIKHP